MTYFTYSIKDTKAGAFGLPFYAQNDALAQRQFIHAVRQNSMMNGFPADYELWKNGIFEDETGSMTGGPITYLMNGQDAVNITKEAEK